MCLAQGHNAVRPVRFEPKAPRSRVKHYTTEPLHSLSKPVVDLKKDIAPSLLLHAKSHKTNAVVTLKKDKTTSLLLPPKAYEF